MSRSQHSEVIFHLISSQQRKHMSALLNERTNKRPKHDSSKRKRKMNYRLCISCVRRVSPTVHFRNGRWPASKLLNTCSASPNIFSFDIIVFIHGCTRSEKGKMPINCIKILIFFFFYYYLANKGENRILLETHLTVAYFFLLPFLCVPFHCFACSSRLDWYLSFIHFCVFIFPSASFVHEVFMTKNWPKEI